MPVSASHPLVADYLARLDAAALALPADRRAELRAEIEGHLADAVPPHATQAEVREAIDRLGDPADIVAAEGDGAAAQPVPGHGVVQDVPARTSPWGPLEIGAVVLLTVGFFLLPVAGPAIGIVLAWVSTRWTRREKVVATLWTLLPLLVAVLAAAALFAVRVDSSSTSETPVRAPTPVVEVSP